MCYITKRHYTSPHKKDETKIASPMYWGTPRPYTSHYLYQETQICNNSRYNCSWVSYLIDFAFGTTPVDIIARHRRVQVTLCLHIMDDFCTFDFGNSMQLVYKYIYYTTLKHKVQTIQRTISENMLPIICCAYTTFTKVNFSIQKYIEN